MSPGRRALFATYAETAVTEIKGDLWLEVTDIFYYSLQ